MLPRTAGGKKKGKEEEHVIERKGEKEEREKERKSERERVCMLAVIS
jgi:hypothetical protein